MAITPKTKSVASGRKKALLIGIDYRNSPLDNLHMPHEDVKQLREFLIAKYEYAPENITVMVDGSPDSELEPTLQNIRHHAANLVAGAEANDHFFFYYSGHSVQIPELSTEQQTELDGMDEVMVPSNGKLDTDKLTRESCLVDNELKRLLINPLPAETTFTAVLDTCHSASLLDLDHIDADGSTSWGGKTAQLSQMSTPPSHRITFIPEASNDDSPVELHNHDKRHAPPPSAAHAACARIKHKGKMPGFYHKGDEPIRCRSPFPDTDPAHLPLVISLSACRDNQVAVENIHDTKGRSFTEEKIHTPSCEISCLKSASRFTECYSTP
ncbi:peptidase C14, caspase domain-containing protein [Mycena filopes]|nr:peptidase C14, caspase domain-containing protein [Mycena filopes]